MSWRLESIERVADRTYRSRLTSEGAEKTFTFQVELRSGIELCVSERGFDEFIGLQEGGGEQLCLAILAFHSARAVR